MMEMVERIRRQAVEGRLRLTQHATQEMAEEGILLDEILEALGNGAILEDYPEHRRGGCCLLGGNGGNRPIHIVCTTGLEMLIIVTVYEPKPPKWISPVERKPKP